MDAREIESLSMLSRGFQELRDVNPELSYSVILDILAGLNECVTSNYLFFGAFILSNACVLPCQERRCTAARADQPGSLPTQACHAEE